LTEYFSGNGSPGSIWIKNC